jgi:hypothetical protein
VQGTPTFRTLPRAAQAYVAVVVAAGAASLVAAAMNVRFEHPWLFAFLMALAFGTSAAKIELPLGRGASNLSFAHAINFWALLAIGPAEATCIATLGAWSQCTLRVGVRNPPHRVLFSIASLTLAVWVVGVPAAVLLNWGGHGVASLLRTAAIIAPIYFLTNTGMVAAAIALSARQPLGRIWHRNFLWSAPS